MCFSCKKSSLLDVDLPSYRKERVVAVRVRPVASAYALGLCVSGRLAASAFVFCVSGWPAAYTFIPCVSGLAAASVNAFVLCGRPAAFASSRWMWTTMSMMQNFSWAWMATMTAFFLCEDSWGEWANASHCVELLCVAIGGRFDSALCRWRKAKTKGA